MNSLVKIVVDLEKERFHPMVYVESPLLGNDNTVTRFKSKMHHTGGFDTLEEANDNAINDLKGKLEGQGWIVTLELEGLVPWDGQGVPTDVILR